MARGGSRNRSGPQVDPKSGRSDRRGVVLTALPSEGYNGDAPRFPLPDERHRETELWQWAWSTPQACAWIEQPWRWYAVAMWVRTAVICESADAAAADKNALHRFADQIGLTPAGLKENGWQIATDELAEKRSSGDSEAPRRGGDVRSRLTVVSDASGA